MGKNNKNKNKEEEKTGTTVGEQVDALYSVFPKEEFLGDPSHHYLFTIPEEQADSLGYLPDSRGHRDDRVKLPAHPSHPSRGTWNGNEFQLTDLGMQSPNYTLFGLNDGGQDPQAVLTYKGGAVIPEITVTPNGNYVENPYDNIIMRQKAKDQGPYYVNIKNYPVVNAEDEELSEYFMNHKDVAGMAIGGGANGIDGPRRIVMNPYSDVLKTDLQKEGLIMIEAVRHVMDENNYKPSFELSEHQKDLQKTVFKDLPYGSNDEAFKQSIISRILVGDADDLQPTPEQEAEAARFIFSNDSTTANQKGEGGTLDTPKKWDNLSFQEKSEMMKIAIRNGVYSLPEIKQKYNEYAEGGKIHIDESKKGTFTAAATKHGMGVQEFASKVMSNPEDYSPEMRKKAVFAKNAAKWHCYGGNLFGGGGYKPSETIKKRISRWEGAAMVRDTIDPLSGKIAKKNASFDTVTKGFVSALPSDIRESVLSNQELADNLYSYAYNVGPGNFKKRVVPTLQKYYKGQASIEDIENSMWASGDSKLRGLQRRRAQERAGVRSALWDYQMGGLNTAISNPMPVFMQDPSQVYNNPLATYEAPVVPAAPEQPLVDAAIRDAYTPEKIAEEERKDRAVLLGSILNNFNQSGEYSPFINAINVLTGRGYSKGGHLFDDGGDTRASIPTLSSIPKFNFNAPVIEKATPEYEEIEPTREIPVEPVKQREPIIPGLSPQQPISDSRFSRSHPIFKDEYDYMNSDAFLTRVKKMTNDNEKARILATNMRNGLYYTKLPNEAFYDYTSNSQNSEYRVDESGPYWHNIYYGQVNDIPGFTKRGVIAHELGHSVYDGNKYGSLLDYHLLSPQYTSVLQRGRHKTLVDDETRGHDHMDTERIADIRGLQQQAKDAGIWDKTTGIDMTPESFNKLKQAYPDNRSFDMWNDEDLRWLINTTAQNNTPTLDYSDRNYLLANGGHLFEDGGDVEEERPPMVPFRQREEVIITPDREYNKYLNTLPDNQRFTPNEEYDSYLYWQLNGKPRNFKEAYDRGMFNYDHSDNGYHGNSIAYDDNGVGYFIKPKTHDTVKYELDWYNKSLVTEEGGHQRPMNKEEQAFHDDFKSKYDLIDDPDRPNYYRYQPKEKAFGGHLYAGGGGIKKYVGDLEDIGYDADNMKFYEKATGKELGDSAILDEVIVNGRNSTKDYLTEANDNTSVYNIPHREYNQHLKDRAEQGAREAAIWREEHPNLSAWGEAAASIPLAVASVPLIAGGAEALAGTSAGQAASSALLSLSNLAKGSTIAGAPAWAWADAGLTSAFAAPGASEIAEGNITPEALMEVAPLGQLAKPIINAGYTGYNTAKSFVDLAKANRGFAVSTPRIGKIFGKDAGQFTAWVPTDRPLTEGISWINTGEPTAEGVPIQYITSKHSGEGRKLYDAVINKALAEGHPGIITGRNLISAPKTFSTLEHYYPSKVKLDDMGHWSNDSMTGLFEGPKKTVYTIDDFLKSVSENPTERVHFYGAPRYRLEKPSTAEITAENAASMTPEQWTVAQDAAIARGDMAEAQRLRDLHASLTPTATPGKYYRGTNTKRNSYPDRHIDEEVGEMNGIYLTKKPKYAKTYGDVEEFYLRSNNPLYTEGNWTGVIDDATRAKIENAGYDAVVNDRFDTGFLNKLFKNSRDETITFDGRNIKSADAVTYDNNGVRIPLGERDNFNINDIRYGLLPFGIGLTGLGLINEE